MNPLSRGPLTGSTCRLAGSALLRWWWCIFPLATMAMLVGCSSIAARTGPRQTSVYPGVRNLEGGGGTGEFAAVGGYMFVADLVLSGGLDTLLLPVDLAYKPKAHNADQAIVSVGRFRGTYEFGSERSVFRPEGDRGKWWVTGNVDELRQRFVALSREESAEFNGPVPVVLVGELSGKGEFGHLGAYKRELRVTQVVEVSRPRTEKYK